MSWLIDLILVSVMAISVIKHFKDGIMSSVYKVASLILSVIAASLLSGPLAGVLASGFVGNGIRDYVYGKTLQFVGDHTSLSVFFQNIPESFDDFLKLFGREVKDLSSVFGESAVNEGVLREMAGFISDPIVKTVSSIIAYVLVFAVTFVSLSIAAYFLKKIRLPLLTSVDRILGAIFGAVIGLFLSSILSVTVFSVAEFLSAINNDAGIMKIYYDSAVFRFIYDLKLFDYIKNLI